MVLFGFCLGFVWVLALSPSSLGIGRATHFGCSPQIHDTSQVPLFTADHSQFLGTIQVPLFSCPQILSTVQVSLFSATPDPYHSPGAVSFLHSTALPSHPDPEPFLSLPFFTSHSPRHTIFRKITCIAKGETPFSGTFMQRHTFFKGIPCIADENHLFCRRQRHLNTPSRAATRLFQRKTLYRERKNIVFRYIHAATHLFQRKTLYRERKSPLLQTTTTPKHTIQSSDTPFSAKFPVSRKGKRCFRKTSKPMSTVTLNRSSRTRFSVRIGG